MAALPDHVVHVWRIGLAAGPEVVARCHDLLDAAERRRALGFGPVALRRRFTVSHGAARAILSGYLGAAPERLDLRVGRWGKPRLAGSAGVQFNLSHTADVALLAVAGQRPVGVDIAHRRAGFPAGAFAARYFTAAERALVHAGGQAVWLRLWARKEAWVKAAGVPISAGVTLPVAWSGAGRCVRDRTGRIPGSWRLRDLPTPAGYAASVALAGGRPYQVVCREFAP